MIKKTFITVLLLFNIILLSGCDIFYPSAPLRSPSSSVNSGENENKAPDFTVYDVNGNKVKLSDFHGKPIVLNFWASWCPPCKAEMPDFEDAYKKYGNDIHFLMINLTDGVQETVKSASSFIAKAGYTFPVYYDQDSSAAMVYGISSIPTTFFIDKDGNVITYATGSLSAQRLEHGISMIK